MNFKIVFLILIIPGFMFSQNKKEIKKNKIKTITEWTTVNQDGKETTYKETYTLFNPKGKMVEETHFGQDGTVKQKETVTFDAHRNKIEETHFDADLRKKEKINYKLAYTYNSDGVKTEETEYDWNGHLIKKMLFSYNAEGYKVEKKTFNDKNVLISVKKYVYENYVKPE